MQCGSVATVPLYSALQVVRLACTGVGSNDLLMEFKRLMVGCCCGRWFENDGAVRRGEVKGKI